MDTELLEFRVEKLPFSSEDNLKEKQIQQVLSKNILSSSGLHYAKFYLSGLKKGQGITVANALRRVLLYDIMGLGLTKVKFNLKNSGDTLEGGESPLESKKIHEFSTISGIRESILELLMNLRLLVWKMPELDQTLKLSDSKEKILINFSGHFSLTEYLKNQSEFSIKNQNIDSAFFVLRAKHLISANQKGLNSERQKFPELINPEQYLATILPIPENRLGIKKFPEFEIEYKIEPGNLLEGREGGTHFSNTDTDEFLLNSGPFFPVKKVNYTVEEVKNSTSNFLREQGFSECVFFEIWTDGSVHPQKALSQAFGILLDFFQQKD